MLLVVLNWPRVGKHHSAVVGKSMSLSVLDHPQACTRPKDYLEFINPSRAIEVVDQKRAAIAPDGSHSLKDYLRVYNDQPEFEISEPEFFCVALVEFMPSIVRNQFATQPDTHIIGSNHETPGLESNRDSKEKTTDDHVTSSDGNLTGKDDLGMVGNLQLG